MQNNVKLSRDEIIICYRDDVAKLMKYLSWLQNKSGTVTSGMYSGEGIDKSSMAVPVYDSTLLNFIRDIKTTDFLNRNYVYTYSRYRIKTAADERRVIEACSLQDITVLGDILSKYVNSLFKFYLQTFIKFSYLNYTTPHTCCICSSCF